MPKTLRSPHDRLMAPAALSCLFALTPFASALAASGWTDTATGVLPLTGATALGAAPASQPLHIAVTLHLQNEAELDQFITSIGTPGNPAFGSKLTSAQVMSSYMPTTTQAQTVADYLTAAGFTNVTIASNRLLIEADGTVGIAEAAFNTPISQYGLGGRTVYANTQTAAVPAALNGLVLSITGLQNAVKPHVNHARPKQILGPMSKAAPLATAATAVTQTLTPQYFAVAYDVQSVPTASTVTGAIYMTGNVSAVESDLRLAEMEANLPQEPVTIKTVDGTVPTAASSGDDEWDLDSQSSQGGATTFKQVIWYDDAGGNLGPAFNQWVADDIAPGMSASIGECEDEAKAGGDLATVDGYLKVAVAQGQTLFASSGDSGPACATAPGTNGTPVGQPFVNYPASSPYAVGVGGTTLMTYADFTYGSESGWTDSGGGFSSFETAPSWQVGVAPQASAPTSLRGVPDIAADGDPGSGAYVIVAGSPEAVGGTSLSAPLSMGLWGRIEAANGGKLGFAAPLIYALDAKGASSSYPTSVTGLHDVTKGSDDVYSAGVGYDYVTGLGSFDTCVIAGLLGNGSANYCTVAPTSVVNTSYPDTTTASTCTIPGMTLNVTPGASTTMLPSQTLVSLAVAEPASMPGKIVFTIKVGSLSTLPHNTAWQALFNTPAGQQFYLQMDTYDAAGTAEFFYGGNVFDPTTNTNTVTNIGALDPASNFNADGTITLVAPETDFGTLTPGGELTYVFSDIYLLAGASAGLLETLDSTSVSLYTIRSTGLCTAAAATGGTTGGTTTGGTTTGGIGSTTTSSAADGRLRGGAFGGLVLGPLALLALLALIRRRLRKRLGIV